LTNKIYLTAKNAKVAKKTNEKTFAFFATFAVKKRFIYQLRNLRKRSTETFDEPVAS